MSWLSIFDFYFIQSIYGEEKYDHVSLVYLGGCPPPPTLQSRVPVWKGGSSTCGQDEVKNHAISKVSNNLGGQVSVLSMAGEEQSLKPGLRVSLEPGSGPFLWPGLGQNSA